MTREESCLGAILEIYRSAVCLNIICSPPVCQAVSIVRSWNTLSTNHHHHGLSTTSFFQLVRIGAIPSDPHSPFSALLSDSSIPSLRPVPITALLSSIVYHMLVDVIRLAILELGYY